MQDRCPGALRLHAASDGLVARVRVPGGKLTHEQLIQLCNVAATGNGLVEITSRGNLQFRGLTGSAAGNIQEYLSSCGLLPSLTHERVRNIVAPALTGRCDSSCVNVDQLVSQLDQQLINQPKLVELSGRFLFAIDDGSAQHLLSGSDIGIQVGAQSTADTCQIFLAGIPTSLVIPTSEAASLVCQIATKFVELKAGNESIWHVRQLAGAAEVLARSVGAALTTSEAVNYSASGSDSSHKLGVRRQPDGLNALVCVVPLGRLKSTVFEHLAAHTNLFTDLRLTGHGTVVLTDVANHNVQQALDMVEFIGWSVDQSSGWLGLSSCIGLGACSKANGDVVALASAQQLTRSSKDESLHIAGCQRCCGRGNAQTVTFINESGQLVNA